MTIAELCSMPSVEVVQRAGELARVGLLVGLARDGRRVAHGIHSGSGNGADVAVVELKNADVSMAVRTLEIAAALARQDHDREEDTARAAGRCRGAKPRAAYKPGGFRAERRRSVGWIAKTAWRAIDENSTALQTQQGRGTCDTQGSDWSRANNSLTNELQTYRVC